MQDFEKLGLFYLGKTIDTSNGNLENDLLLYDSKNFTTHAVCLGMTGSGKTGLGITLLEEAAIDKIPAIIIDPKGDLSNLLLTFPELSPEEFEPWIDQAEAERKGMSSEEYSAYVAKLWKDGLAAWREDGKRIKSFRDAVELKIYTPASKAGVPLSILSSFAAPSQELSLDPTAIQEKAFSITASLLGLVGIDADPIKSREYILISTIIEQAWQKKRDLDIGMIIQQIQKPPFSQIGVLDIDTFYPLKERVNLSIRLNNLLASPRFQAWMEGEPLDIQGLLYASTGKPKLSIISIAHLSDAERMFFVTLLLNELLSWMRQQSGTSSLRALLYMDEIFGYFPPTATPPSKLPMLMLLKQARAFGLGIILATQNPVDLDYKGLANCGTWFIGKLQTERDKARVLEGLKTASNGDLEVSSLDKALALSGNRTFLMRSIHEKEPILFQTRWTLSYLRGPLTLVQIASLTDQEDHQAIQDEVSKKQKNVASSKPLIPPGIDEFFIHSASNKSSQPHHYEPQVVAIAKMHFVDTKNKIDVWKEANFILPFDTERHGIDWGKSKNIPSLNKLLNKEPIPESTFGELPEELLQKKTYEALAKEFLKLLYQNQTLTIYQFKEFKLSSQIEESERDFRIRVLQEMRERRDETVRKLRDKYSTKISSLSDKLKRAQEKMAQAKEKAGQQKMETVLSVGTTVLGALFGRGVTKGTISATGRSLKRAGQAGKSSQDTSMAEEESRTCQQQLQSLEIQMEKEIAEINLIPDPESIDLQVVYLHPKKSDLSVEKIALVWLLTS